MSGVWTVCRGVGRPGTEAEGKVGEVQLELSLNQARLAVMHWARHPASWAEVAVQHGADPDSRWADYDWTFEQQPPPPVAHVAGMMMARRGVARQRCLWCGTLLYEIPMTTEEALEFNGSILGVGEWYEAHGLTVDGRPHLEWMEQSATRVEPDNACTRLPDERYTMTVDDAPLFETDKDGRPLPAPAAGHPEVW